MKTTPGSKKGKGKAQGKRKPGNKGPPKSPNKSVAKNVKKAVPAATKSEVAKTGIEKKSTTKVDDAMFVKESMLYYQKVIICDKKDAEALHKAVANLLSHMLKHPRSLAELAAKGRLSRALQSCLKYGSKEQKKSLLPALVDHFSDLCMSQGGHNLACKLYLYGSRDMQKEMANLVSQKSKIFFAKYGAVVWEFIYNKEVTASKKKMLTKIVLPKPLQVKHKAILTQKLDTVIETLKKEYTDDYNDVKKRLEDLVQRLIDKELLSKSHVHELLASLYQMLSSDEERKDWASRLSEGFHHLTSTKEGTNVLIALLGHCDSKSRKALIKSTKGSMVDMACNPANFLLVIRLITIVDDTRLINESIIQPLTRNTVQLCHHKSGRKVLMALLNEADMKSILTEHELKMIASPSPMSRKAPHTRSEEIRPPLLEGIQDALTLQYETKDRANGMAAVIYDDDCGSCVVSAIRASPTPEMFEALIKACALKSDGKYRVLESANAHKTISSILKSTGDHEHTIDFAARLWTDVFNEALGTAQDIASFAKNTSGGAFLLADVYRLTGGPKGVAQKIGEAKPMLASENGKKGLQILVAMI
eukprot:GHVO01013300.1.p1 GENE.GHVO01013300.1~~GHVO01013300.1.p1  ORF type:complete len:597 (-),score=114.91 GHVO01013300.1:103-1872(-)